MPPHNRMRPGACFRRTPVILSRPHLRFRVPLQSRIVIINGGFDILQSATHSRDLSTIKFGTGAKNLWNNLKDPFTQINKYGWERFIGNEVFPVSLKIDQAQYFPNYTLHLIGGGMESRMMHEWYLAHEVPLPVALHRTHSRRLSFCERGGRKRLYVGPNVDPIADVYLFDIGGVILFSSDAVGRIFQPHVQLNDWSGQVAYNPRSTRSKTRDTTSS